MSYFQLLNTRMVARMGAHRRDSGDRLVGRDEVKIVLTPRQYLKYYAARYHGSGQIDLLFSNSSSLREARSPDENEKENENPDMSKKTKKNDGEVDDGQEV